MCEAGKNGVPKSTASFTWPRRRHVRRNPKDLGRPDWRVTGMGADCCREAIGYDLESARALNAILAVQLRGIPIFAMTTTWQGNGAEPSGIPLGHPLSSALEHGRYVDSVTITAAEEVDSYNRGGYYDHRGALRDMVQIT